MAEHAGKPKVRFAGFTEAWEQRKVGNLIEDYVERTTIQNQYPVLTSSQQQGIVLQEAYFADRQVTTNDNVGYFVLPKGYFTYRSRSDTDVFVFNRNDILDKGIISYYYPVFQTKYTCSDFLLRRLNHGIRKQLAMAAEGTGQKVLAHSKFKNMTVSVPKIGEQQKIGTFFRQLDRLVTLHQRKRGRLENIKKAMLEKMFPKNGADVPEIRFAGFTEAWEQRELSYWATRYDHLRIPITASNRVSGTTPYYGANGIQDYVSGYTHDGEFILVAEDGANDLKNYPVQYVSGKIWVNNHAHVLQANTNIADNKFLKFAISQANIEPFLVGGGRSKLNAEIMMKISILAPKNIQEQARIGTFFRHLDRLITLHQRKVTLLQNIKKACLEKMFV